VANAETQHRKEFNLRPFHDFVWKNGNVPMALQDWEYLGENHGVPLFGR